MNRYRVLIAGMGLFVASVHCLPAQSNTAEVFGGYSYAKINPEATLPKQNTSGWFGGAGGYANRWLGAGMEIAAHFGTIPPPGGAPAMGFKEYSYLVGPQIRVVNTSRVQAAGKVLLGGVFGQVRASETTTPAQLQAMNAAGYNNFDSTKFAMLFAAPVDVSVTRILGIRIEPGLFRSSFIKEHQNNFRLSVGTVFRFGGK